ncbi:MAG: UDP-N-acetylmuramoyl-tripeptide--D-alanyl-D-alanine ligase, partial [Verrucomicrobiota bacterium]
MKNVTLSSLADWCNGALIQGVPETSLSSVSTDSRKVAEGDLFVALKGDRFDAHDFLEAVVEAGAGALLVSELPVTTQGFEGGIIHVRSPLVALQEIARQHRLHSGSLRVVGLTGSNGKTSTKDFLAEVLGRKGRVNKTQGNLNNHIGLPLTILSGGDEDSFGVWEMGMNHSGEIEVLVEIGNPDVAVITHIGTAHIENLKTRDAIAKEKSEIAMGINSKGYCVMPEEDDYFEFVRDRVSCRMISVG